MSWNRTLSLAAYFFYGAVLIGNARGRHRALLFLPPELLRVKRVALAIALCLASSAAAEPRTALTPEARAKEYLELTAAVRARDPGLVEALLERGVDPRHSPESVDSEAEYFASLEDPVQIAAMLGDAEVIRVLLAHGGNPEWMCCSGETALVIAAEGGHAAAVRALLDGGASPLEMGDHGPPLVVALARSHYAVARMLALPTLWALAPALAVLAALSLGPVLLAWRLRKVRRAAADE